MKFKVLFGAVIATVLTACGGGGGSSSSNSGGGGGGGGTTPTPTNNAPTFSSAETASIAEGQTTVIILEFLSPLRLPKDCGWNSFASAIYNIEIKI